MRIFRINSLSNFETYHTALLTIVITLYVTFLVPIYLIKEVYIIPFDHFHLIPPPPTYISRKHKSDLFFYESGFFYEFCFCFYLEPTYKWYHRVFVFVWLVSLSIMPSGSIHFVKNVNIYIFFWLNSISLCVCIYTSIYIYVYIYTHTHTPHLLYPF